MTETMLIVGGGLTGASAAETLRSEGFAGRVAILSADPHPPYDRPPLSKAVLLGTKPPESAVLHPTRWYAERDIELRTGTLVTRLDLAAHEVHVEGGSLEYDRLLLATGAVPRRPKIPGAELPGVNYLRTLDDSVRLLEQLRSKVPVVVIGAGWIGLEVAAAARHHGCDVTVVEQARWPLLAPLGEELGRVYADLHRRNRVDLRLDTGVAAIEGSGTSLAGVRLSDGYLLPAGLVLVGVGVAPVTGLAEAAGLDVVDGIVADEHLQTSDPDVYAAGDCASPWHPRYGRHLRVEHWANALNGGPAAARSMLGQQVTFDRLPYFFSDQYDLGMEFTGLAEPGTYDRVVFRGRPCDDGGGTGAFIAFWVSRTGRVVAALNANIWDVVADLQALIQSAAAVSDDRLADPEVPLSELAAT